MKTGTRLNYPKPTLHKQKKRENKTIWPNPCPESRKKMVR